MREIVLDTETTGFDPEEGHRLIEIGCLELENFVPTGRTFHQYLNPERDVPLDAVAIHGLTSEFLSDKPVIAEIVDDFLAFIEDAPLVIHNAEFDLKFINAELKRLGFRAIKNSITDTVLMARQKYPGQPANLDALCRRFKIDNTERTLHGALLDAQLLAEVYLELMGGRQQGFLLSVENGPVKGGAKEGSAVQKKHYPPRTFSVNVSEEAAHAEMVKTIGVGAIWNKYAM